MWGQVAAHWSSDWGAHAVILQSEGAVSKSFYIYIIRLHFLILLYIYHSSPSSPLFETSIYISFVSIVSTFWIYISFVSIVSTFVLHFQLDLFVQISQQNIDNRWLTLLFHFITLYFEIKNNQLHLTLLSHFITLYFETKNNDKHGF